MRLCDKPFVAVRWADAHGSATNELAEHEIAHAAAHYTIYGFALRQDDKGISLASEISDEATYRGISFIPAAMIVEVVPLRLAKPRTKRIEG